MPSKFSFFMGGTIMENPVRPLLKKTANRRSFLKNGAVAAGATVGASLLAGAPASFALARMEDEGGHGDLTRGDVAILRFLQALETIEADLWTQYAELGGATNQNLSPIDLPFTTGISPDYTVALQFLDGDMPQYIADNTDDELSHSAWLAAFLEMKGIEPVDLTPFAHLKPSKVTGVPQKGRLTNLMQLTVDTSWWTRYRSATLNPDLGDTNFPNAVPDLAKAPHPAIPRDDNDIDAAANNLTANPPVINTHLQAIANTAGFHFGFIEQGGSSLYPSLAQRVHNAEVLRILLSIGPTETSHFQTWHDKAGNAPQLTDGNLTFPNLSFPIPPTPGQSTDPNVADALQSNLIMPEPTFFLSRKLPAISIIRPTETENAAKGAVKSLMDDGLFTGHIVNGKSDGFIELLKDLAEDADEARR
jgi:hypothetical protein